MSDRAVIDGLARPDAPTPSSIMANPPDSMVSLQYRSTE